MPDTRFPRCFAFEGLRRVAVGPVPEVARAVKELLDAGGTAPVLILDATDCRPVELDLRGSLDEALRRVDRAFPPPAEPPPAEAGDGQRGPGRPRLGVVGREVTLLPRHWEWLNRQPGGASVTLRKLVELARRSTAGDEAEQRPRDATYRFLQAVAGDLPGYEEALRALYAGDPGAFAGRIDGWPRDVRAQAEELAARAFRPTAAGAVERAEDVI